MPRSFEHIVRICEPNEKPEHKPYFFDIGFAITNLIYRRYLCKVRQKGRATFPF